MAGKIAAQKLDDFHDKHMIVRYDDDDEGGGDNHDLDWSLNHSFVITAFYDPMFNFRESTGIEYFPPATGTVRFTISGKSINHRAVCYSFNEFIWIIITIITSF